ncbi:hypothetical protein CWB41_09350 [Methylovirgula ligni]|uniref:Uncharacterized protein n=1 Tax=Methylovirgula ligni TaxID=569860 RepID=A0A3D9YV90_9HYPH|nr:hypothetical protein [Methylovirgula ligni]QAY95906.1 hypothetical protein CWB41_09350 [Methylovirgula ligni]REF86434.1 hypothetical protein DES32_2488 [Methylovirgula ligni]
MAAKREKTISYRRAEWLDEANTTLEKCVRDALKKLPTVSDREIVNGGQITRIAKHKDGSSGGLFLHITSDTPGEPASVVPKAAPGAAELDLRVQKPPQDAEWLDGDALLFIRHDHVCLCTTGMRDGAIGYFLRELFRKARIRSDSTKFELMKAADITKLKLLHSQGVKELEIRGTLYKATADYESRKAQMAGTIGAVGKFVKAFLEKPNDVTPDALRATIVLKVDRRFSNGLDLGYKNLEKMAADIVGKANKEDDYVIVTKKGQKISPDEIFIKETILLDADGKTVNRDKTWRELNHFYSALNDAGVLEQ